MPFEADEEKDYSIQVINEEKPDGAVTFQAVLQNCTEAVITLDLKLTNMTCDHTLPVTVNAAGRKQFEIASIWTSNANSTSHYEFKARAIAGRLAPGVRHNHVYALPYSSGRYVLDYVLPTRRDSRLARVQPNDECFVGWRMPEGTVVRAAREGTVIAVRADVETAVGGAGNYVVIRHADGTFGQYIHLRPNSLLIQLGQKVAIHQPLALSGKTGWVNHPQLAFQVYVPLSGKTLRGFPIIFRTPDGKRVVTEPGKQYYL